MLPEPPKPICRAISPAAMRRKIDWRPRAYCDSYRYGLPGLCSAWDASRNNPRSLWQWTKLRETGARCCGEDTASQSRLQTDADEVKASLEPSLAAKLERMTRGICSQPRRPWWRRLVGG